MDTLYTILFLMDPRIWNGMMPSWQVVQFCAIALNMYIISQKLHHLPVWQHAIPDTIAPMEENGIQFVHSTLGILNSLNNRCSGPNLLLYSLWLLVQEQHFTI